MLRKYDIASLCFTMMRCLPYNVVQLPSFAKGKHHSKKSIFLDRQMDFLLAYYYKIDPYKAIVQKQSEQFTVRGHLSLDDDGRKKLSEVYRAFALYIQRNLCINNTHLIFVFINDFTYIVRINDIVRNIIFIK